MRHPRRNSKRAGNKPIISVHAARRKQARRERRRLVRGLVNVVESLK